MQLSTALYQRFPYEAHAHKQAHSQDATGLAHNLNQPLYILSGIAIHGTAAFTVFDYRLLRHAGPQHGVR